MPAMASSQRQRTPISWLERRVGAVLSKCVLAPDRLVYATPTELGLTARPLEVTDASGPGAVHFRGYEFLPAAAAAAPVVVLFPGISANLSAHLLYVEMAVRAGLRVIAFDYRGFGASNGTPSVAELLADAHRICDFALTRTEGPIGLFGVSLGANVALAIAADRPDDIGSVAIEGISDQRQLMEGILTSGLTGPRSVQRVYLEGVEHFDRERLCVSRFRAPRLAARAVSRIAESTYPFAGKSPRSLLPSLHRVPLYVVHGIDDPVLPFELSVDVFVSASDLGSRLWLIPAIGHAQEPALGADAEYVAQLARFFAASLGASDSPVKTQQPTLETESSSVSTTGNAAGRSLTVTLPPDAPPGAFLVGSLSDDTVELWRLWLDSGERVTRRLRNRPAATWALRVECATRRGSSWDSLLSPRSKLYRSHYRAPLAQLSSSLRRANVTEAKAALQGLLDLSPPDPFDLYLRIHAARLASVARRRAPAIARWARATFRDLGGGDGEGPDRDNGNRGHPS